MQSVLISIRPQWCEMICNGKKTIEVRKTRPKLDTALIRCKTAPLHSLASEVSSYFFILFSPFVVSMNT